MEILQKVAGTFCFTAFHRIENIRPNLRFLRLVSQRWKMSSKKRSALHPWNLTWNLKRSPWKRWFLLETIIFRVHVKFWGSKLFMIFMTTGFKNLHQQKVMNQKKWPPLFSGRKDRVPVMLNHPWFMSSSKRSLKKSLLSIGSSAHSKHAI